MERAITKAQAQAFRERWKVVHAAERRELRETPPALKLKQLVALMSSVEQLGWAEALAADAASVRERWCRLRSRLARD